MRTSYQQTDDVLNERNIAKRFCLSQAVAHMKIGLPEDQMQPGMYRPRVDFAIVHQAQIVGFFDVKRCNSRAWGEGRGWATGARKFEHMRALYRCMHLPVLYVVRFADNVIGSVPVTTVASEYIKEWGRTDRNDVRDIETGVLFRWDQITRVREAAPAESNLPSLLTPAT